MKDVHLLRMEAPELASQARPGQFVMVRCGPGLLLRRPMSIHEVKGGQISLLVEKVGRGTEWLCKQQPGDKLDIIGPLGNGFTFAPQARSLLLVAGGMGIAPIAFMAQQARQKGCRVTLLLGASKGERIYPTPRLPSGLTLDVITEDGSLGRKGLVTDWLPKLTPEADQIIACGPESMYRAMANLLTEFKRSVQVSLEAWLGCGLGACYACTVQTRHGPKQLCRDGPVFELSELVW